MNLSLQWLLIRPTLRTTVKVKSALFTV